MNKRFALIFFTLMMCLLQAPSIGFTEGYYASDGSYVTPSQVSPEEIERQKQEFLDKAKKDGEAGVRGYRETTFEDGTVLKVKLGEHSSTTGKLGKFIPLILVGVVLAGAYLLFLK